MQYVRSVIKKSGNYIKNIKNNTKESNIMNVFAQLFYGLLITGFMFGVLTTLAIDALIYIIMYFIKKYKGGKHR